MADFQDYIAAEKARLTSELEKMAAERAALDARQATVAAEMKAVQACETAKTGKPAAARGRKATSSRKGSKREGIMAAINAAPGGMTRGELLERMGLKGNKSGEMSVSNALTALIKGNQVVREGGKYRPAA